MSFWTLVRLIAFAWLSYPIIGGIGVQRSIVEGRRPEDAGFSFVPELIAFPPLFLGFAMAVDYFAKPWGRWFVGSVCVLMLAVGWLSSVWNLWIIYRAKRQ